MCQTDYKQALTKKQLPTIWSIPDQMWQKIRGLLPKQKAKNTPGRPPIPYRTVLNGILFVLRTGCHWKAIPKEFGSGSTVHRRFQQWEQAGIIDEIIKQMLVWYDQTHRIDWQWQSADTKMLPSPLGGEDTGPNPTDRAKSGTKRHLVIDGNGAPLAFLLTGANTPDMKGFPELIEEKFLVERPQPTLCSPQHICLDKGYDYDVIDAVVDKLGYKKHIKRRGEVSVKGIGEPIYPARRWKVERTISWLSNMRKLRIRWEKKSANYRALWLIAAALIIFRLIVLG